MIGVFMSIIIDNGESLLALYANPEDVLSRQSRRRGLSAELTSLHLPRSTISRTVNEGLTARWSAMSCQWREACREDLQPFLPLHLIQRCAAERWSRKARNAGAHFSASRPLARWP